VVNNLRSKSNNSSIQRLFTPLLGFLPHDHELLIKLLWHYAINLRATVVEYLLRSTKLKETLTPEEAQKMLLRMYKT